MPLEMRPICERCGESLAHDAPARICSFECTFCPRCSAAMACVCPNCGGELLGRPRRGVPGTPRVCWEMAEGDLVVSDDAQRIDYPFVHAFLRESYWSPGIPPGLVRRAASHSLTLGVYERGGGGVTGGSRQVGYGRAITDRSTYAYLCDIFVAPEARGRGAAALLMRAFDAHPDLQGLRRWMLLTKDAHGLYRKFGFAEPAKPQAIMERWDPDVYARMNAANA